MYLKGNSLLINMLGLPKIESFDDLHEQMRLSKRLLYCLTKRSDQYYHIAYIPKRDGTKRELDVPSYTMRMAQKWVLRNILDKLSPTECAMAFRKGEFYNHKQNAKCHAHSLYGLSLDLKDFFPSIASKRVYQVYKSIGYNNTIATILTNLCTKDGKLPQGGVCSPALSNLICMTLDRRLIGLCEKEGILYTRYADDMFFSCNNKGLLLKKYPTIIDIIVDEGFAINERKTHYQSGRAKSAITGITISRSNRKEYFELKAPKELKRKIRAEIFRCMLSGDYSQRQHIIGEIEYVDYIERENGQQFKDGIKKYIGKLSGLLCYFSELVKAYNENKFYSDMEDLDYDGISISDEEDDVDLWMQYKQRKEYLQKRCIADICSYSDWPEWIFEENADIVEGEPF